MTVSGYGYQEFQSGPDTFEVRVIPGTALTQGRAFIMWDDIQDIFPLAARLQCGRRVVSFMVDINGNRLLPLRIEHHPGSAIQVIMSRGSSLKGPPPPIPPKQRRRSPPPIPPPPILQPPSGPLSPTSAPPSPSQQLSPTAHRGAQKHGSYIATFTLANIDDDEEDDDSTRRDSLFSTLSLSNETKTQYRSSVYLYESFLQSIQLGQTSQADLICDDFREQFLTLEAEMTCNKGLQKQMLEMQQSMIELQQQALDRLTNIQNKVQEILVQNFAIYEYPIPRLFIVLPSDRLKWDPVNIFENKFKLFFLCECGEHTKGDQGNNRNPHHIHLAKHDGYDIESPAEFFRNYGNYVMNLLHMLKYGVAVAGYTTPALVPTNPRSSMDGKHWERSEDYINSLERNVERSLEYLECMAIKGQLTPPPPKVRISLQLKSNPGQMDVTELRRLGAYLKINDSDEVLGNLYRVVTADGHAKWVCEEHYIEMHGLQAIKELCQGTYVNHGSFNEHFGRAEVSLTSPTVANLFYKLTERSRLVQELKVNLKWDVAVSDLKTLRDVIRRSNIAYLDLTCPGAPAPSDILNRNKRSDPIWDMISTSKLQSFTLNDYYGFFSKVTVSAKKNKLRIFRSTERIDWRKEGVKVVELIEKSPLLKELRLCTTEIDDAYTAIRKTNMYESCALDHLTLDGGDAHGLQAKFEGGLPVSIDLIVADLSSPLLQDVQLLRSLHLRTGPHTRMDIEPSMLIGVVRRNPNMTKLTIQCGITDFLFWLKIASNCVAGEGYSKLKMLRLYSGRNQLLLNNLPDENSMELELMSLNNISRDGLETLLKAHASKLTRLRIDSEILRSMFDTAFPGRSTTTLRQLDILSSALTLDMLYDLRLILRRSNDVANLTIVLDERYDGSEKSKELADFVAEFAQHWKKITIKDVDVTMWKEALSKHKFTIPFGVLSVVPNTRSDYIVLANVGIIGKSK
ncbi:hypothetical protein BGX21_010270 [Mortierella sp. AD011]|nr:hypothetical protein BGX20_009585 [Mortierella sp. AD010]KAF9394656.1 hypothetical protein BGX21_010270 [Mortierella sp. AD011]